MAEVNIRDSAKWLVTAITAFTGIVFASGGFIVRGTMGESYFWQRATAMTLGGIAAALGLSAIIGAIVWVMTPEEPTLDALPDELDDAIRAHPEVYLPNGHTTIEGFREQYTELELDVRKRRATARQERAKAVHARSALAAAKATTPPDPGEVARLEEETRNQEQLATQREIWAEQVKEGFGKFEEAYQLIIARARYLTTKAKFRRARSWLITGGVLVIIGATTYTIAVSYTPPEASKSTTPQLATLTSTGTPASDALWEAADLDGCEADGEVPVLLSSGDGTTASPWKVQTLPAPGCEVVSLSVISEVGTVVVPEEEITIVYETTTVPPSTTTHGG